MIALGHRTIEPGTGHEAGRTLLAELFRAHVGGELPSIRVTDRGKPFFEDSPIHFSITHTKHHVFAALSDRPIGIDAEERDRSISLALADKILSPAEKARFALADDKQAALLRLWVQKEAAAKRTGVGLRGYPNHTDFSPEDPGILQIHGCYVAVSEEDDHVI